jgi:hypothetical protein
MQHYVIKFVSYLRQVGGFFRFPQSIQLTAFPYPCLCRILIIYLYFTVFNNLVEHKWDPFFDDDCKSIKG